jgi:hypothetical protein
MQAPIPYFDLAGYKRLTKHPGTVIDLIAAKEPGYIEHCAAVGSSRINARLAKRYVVPLGQEAPVLLASGTLPPPVSLSGRPTLGSLEMAIQITVSGPATFQWSLDGGLTWANGGVLTTSWPMPLGATGLAATFGAGVYSTDNFYRASTPVPEIALNWLARMVDIDVWDKRGANPQDPTIERWVALRQESLDEIKEAADSKDGLFELPMIDSQGDSAIEHGGPIFYSETSPYVWTDMQGCLGRLEDRQRGGTWGGS